MASVAIISFRPSTIIACANPKADRRSDGRGRRSGGSGGNGNWWTPLLGWPAVPDYVEAVASSPEKGEAGDGEGQNRPRRFSVLTEEKARELRMRTSEMESFHDVMYHSAIASRLASDRRSEI